MMRKVWIQVLYKGFTVPLPQKRKKRLNSNVDVLWFLNINNRKKYILNFFQSLKCSGYELFLEPVLWFYFTRIQGSCKLLITFSLPSDPFSVPPSEHTCNTVYPLHAGPVKEPIPNWKLTVLSKVLLKNSKNNCVVLCYRI